MTSVQFESQLWLDQCLLRLSFGPDWCFPKHVLDQISPRDSGVYTQPMLTLVSSINLINIYLQIQVY